MPLVTVTLQRPRTREGKTAILDAVHRSLVAAGVPEADRFQRVLELDEHDFRFDARYPDARTPRSRDFVLIEILWSVGRSVRVKRKLVADITEALARDAGLDPEQVMIVFVETAWENWAFAGGRLLHAEK
jgi:phenylpyruvate tautomerase PptA (4-oxalocrotonate tautomerase family)